ncbi:unnamed protein product [Boreogadus saida]
MSPDAAGLSVSVQAARALSIRYLLTDRPVRHHVVLRAFLVACVCVWLREGHRIATALLPVSPRISCCFCPQRDTLALRFSARLNKVGDATVVLLHLSLRCHQCVAEIDRHLHVSARPSCGSSAGRRTDESARRL